MCGIEGCEAEVHAGGLCPKHYQQARRRERGLKKPGPAPDPSKPKSRHNPDGERGPSELSPEVRAKRGGRRKSATDTHCANGHPWTEGSWYWQKNENYAEGRRRMCRLCARNWQTKYRGREPIPDDVPISPKNAKKTHCPQGHEYSEENTHITPDGSRACVACRKVRAAKARLEKYGLNEATFDELLERAEGRCEICQSDDPLHIDHDHHSGDVRGLLCNNCNNGLGRFSDDPARLRAALRYLEGQSTE